jgi:hypothetical protein
MSSGMALLDMAAVFDSKWIERPLYKLANLDFQMYLLKTISYLHSRTYQTSFHSAISARSSKGVEWFRVNLCPTSSSKYDGPAPSVAFLRGSRGRQNHTDTSCQTTLLVGYIQASLKRLEHCLRDWRTASRRAPQCSTSRRRELSKSLKMYSSLGNQSSGSIQVGIFGWTVTILAGETISLLTDDFLFF